MLALSLILATHVPQELYLKCNHLDWLRQELLESKLFTPAESAEIIHNWIEHTDPKCFT